MVAQPVEDAGRSELVFGRAAATPSRSGSARSSARRRSAERCWCCGTGAALLWANSPVGDSYFALRDFSFGYAPWQLELSIGQWSADGLLAIFFFLVGLELKREFVAGDLRDPARPSSRSPRPSAACGARPDLRRRQLAATRKPCAAGPSRPQPTSPSPSLCLPSSARTCPARCGSSC